MMYWYQGDFGGSEAEVLRWIWNNSSEILRDQLQVLDPSCKFRSNANITVKYRNFQYQFHTQYRRLEVELKKIEGDDQLEEERFDVSDQEARARFLKEMREEEEERVREGEREKEKEKEKEKETESENGKVAGEKREGGEELMRRTLGERVEEEDEDQEMRNSI
eukprot:CAMPEP_0201504094 /NCGR_PEP_ID=MMETSP0151_2-20130828/85021_1 /ASSEMBLY_ACC=CAM_ASM_000257 /TAXON_ID=200890 /ORGANISM="Paramoeba atlantica, Strain 621/1 / CCAP 1560/9" /LENGTH=163 /DNA_ID=CAMNT_0047897803 /DNA_START=753 /DNA_END=1244 /DNA_ORIENTATION=-